MTIIQYLLGVLDEECKEVGIRCSKAVRFGIDEIQPEQDLDNRQRIIYELNDLFAVIELLSEEGVAMPGIRRFPDGLEGIVIDRGMVDLKKEKVRKFMKLSRERGMLEEENLF